MPIDIMNEENVRSRCPFFANVNNDTYHAAPGLSSTGLKNFIKSPATYLRKLEEYKEPDYFKKPAFVQGTLIHTCVLEPDKVDSEVFVLPELNLRTNAGKAERDELLEKNAGKQVVTKEQMDIALDIAKRVKADASCQSFLNTENKGIEVSYWWVDEATDVLCKARPDFINLDLPCMVDLKSTDDCSAGAFGRDVQNYLYDVQAGFYLRGYYAVTSAWIRNFAFLAVEKENPFMPPMVYTMEESYLETADLIINNALKRYAQFLSGELTYLGYGESNIRVLEQPNWFRNF